VLATLARYLDLLHRHCGRSRRLVNLAVKVRNQADAVIRARMADGIVGTENGEQLLIDLVAPQADRFVDIGANVGNWTLAFLAKCGKPASGYLFEPSPIAYQLLKQAVAKSSNQDGVSLEIVCQALGDCAGEISFYVEPCAGETSSFVKSHTHRDAKMIKVVVGTLDDELEKRTIEDVDIVKIDAEGFDCKILRGAANAITRQAFGVIQFEYNGPWAKVGDTLYSAIHLLTRSGYEVFLLKRNGLYRFDYDLYGEFFGYSNFVAVSPRYATTLRRIVIGKL
jgi:FkbM family methyltransferase